MKMYYRCRLMQSHTSAKGLTGIPKRALWTRHQAEYKLCKQAWEASQGTKHETWTRLRAVRLARAAKELPWTVPQPVRSRCCNATSADMACSIKTKPINPAPRTVIVLSTFTHKCCLPPCLSGNNAHVSMRTARLGRLLKQAWEIRKLD